jgi:small GTP-binding protein
MPQRQYTMKVCLVGDGAVGKTSLIRRLVHNEFDEAYLYTLGTNVSRKDIVLEGGHHETTSVAMLVWDILGQGSLASLMSKSYFRGADGGVAVCDLTRRETLLNLREWIASMRAVVNEVPLALVANKSDLHEDHQIDEEEISSFASELDATFYITSAKTGEGVEEAFRELALRAIDCGRLDFFGG